MKQLSLTIIMIIFAGFMPKISYGYTEYLKISPLPDDIAIIEKAPQKKSITDRFGQTYTVTKNGLLLSASEESKDKKYSWPASLVRRIVHFIKSIADFFGVDSLSAFANKFIEGDDGRLIIDGKAGLPYEDLTSIDQNENGEILLGSSHGLILLSRGKFFYFAGPRWLDNGKSDNKIIKAVFHKDNLLAQTKSGVSKIQRFEFTLKAKEKYYDKAINEKFKRFGFVGPRYQDHVTVTDNDGLWTSLYIAAQSFKYAVTKDEAAKRNAAESINALIFLRKVTGLPGFIARAVIHKNEPLNYIMQSGEWHKSEIYPEWFWKGDTSFDELIGHFFAYGIYYDLAADEKMKKAVEEQVNAISDHLIANKFCLIDLDGQPTKWAQGNPDDTFRNLWHFFGRGPLSLGTLSVLKTAAHITKRKDIRQLYEKLVTEYRYALNTYNAKIIDNYSDDELALLAYFNLIRLEENPELKNLYLVSLNRYWQHVRDEKNPLWNFIYGGLSGSHCEYDSAVQTLEEIPLDLRLVWMQNSQRKDVKVIKKKKRGEFWRKDSLMLGEKVLSPRERGIMRWNDDPYRLDYGNWWREDEMEPTFWLLPYWMGKYYKYF